MSGNGKENFHIYFNDNKREIRKTKIKRKDKVIKFNIKIDYKVNSFYELFYHCECIEPIYFKKFNRNNINDMSYISFEYTSLEELDLSNFNTYNVTNMSYMFADYPSFKKLDLSNFNSNNVINMSQISHYVHH